MKNSIEELANTFAAYRAGWEDLWKKQGKNHNPHQKAEVIALLEKEQAAQMQMIQQFLDYCQHHPVDEILINIDIQRSFIDEPVNAKETIGTLGVKGTHGEGNALSKMIALQSYFTTILNTLDTQLEHDDPTFSQTWNKPDFAEAMVEFAGKQYRNTVWPNHCIHTTEGFKKPKALVEAQLHALFNLDIHKGGFSGVENLSGIQDQAGNRGVLPHLLKIARPKRLVFAGLTLDLCVQSTIHHVLDMRDAGEIPDVEIILIEDATAAVFPEKGEQHLKQLKERSVKVMTLDGFKEMKR